MTFKEFYKRVMFRLWSKETILLLIRPANAPLDEALCTPKRGELRFVGEELLPDCSDCDNAEHLVPIFREMLQRGNLVQFGYLDGKCVFRHCLQCKGKFFLSGNTAQTLQKNEGYILYGYCAPIARGYGMHTASIARMIALHPDWTFYTLVREENPASLYGCYRAGLVPVSRITSGRRLNREFFKEEKLTQDEVDRLFSKM